ALESILIVIVEVGIYLLPINEYVQVGRRSQKVGARQQIGGADDPVHGDQSAIGLRANHLIEAWLDCFGQRTMSEELNFAAFNKWPETRLHGSANQDAIAGNEFRACRRRDKNCGISVLDE